MTTLMDLRRLTRSRLGVPVSDDFITDTVLDDHINLAVQTLETEYHWPWSDVVQIVSISPDAPDIPMPDGYRATRTIFEDNNELQLVSPSDLLTWSTAGFDVPRVYCPIADAIAVRPVVQSSHQLIHYWYRQPMWLSKDEDTPGSPDQFTGALVAKAAALLASREGATADAQRHNQEYADWLNRMRRDVRRSTTPTRVRVRPGGWI